MYIDKDKQGKKVAAKEKNAAEIEEERERRLEELLEEIREQHSETGHQPNKSNNLKLGKHLFHPLLFIELRYSRGKRR